MVRHRFLAVLLRPITLFGQGFLPIQRVIVHTHFAIQGKQFAVRGHNQWVDF